MDNGLSRKGKAQAKALKRFFSSVDLEGSVALMSSPKKRCVETLIPLSRLLKKPVSISPLLDDFSFQGERETDLKKRVLKFLRSVARMNKDNFVISCHGDFIPVVLQSLLGIEASLAKGGLAEIVLEGPKGRLVNLIQKWV